MDRTRDPGRAGDPRGHVDDWSSARAEAALRTSEARQATLMILRGRPPLRAGRSRRRGRGSGDHARASHVLRLAGPRYWPGSCWRSGSRGAPSGGASTSAGAPPPRCCAFPSWGLSSGRPRWPLGRDSRSCSAAGRQFRPRSRSRPTPWEPTCCGTNSSRSRAATWKAAHSRRR